jgi:hypothetical protein
MRRGEQTGNPIAGARLQFQELVPKDDKEREIIIEETLAKDMIDWPERAGHA